MKLYFLVEIDVDTACYMREHNKGTSAELFASEVKSNLESCHQSGVVEARVFSAGMLRGTIKDLPEWTWGKLTREVEGIGRMEKS